MWPKFDFLYNLLFTKKTDNAVLARELDKVLQLAQDETEKFDKAHCIENDVDDIIEATDEQCTLSRGMDTAAPLVEFIHLLLFYNIFR